MNYDKALTRAIARHTDGDGPDADGESVTLVIVRGTQRLLVDVVVGDTTTTVLGVEGNGPLSIGDDVALTAAEQAEARGEAEMRLIDREAAQREDARPYYDEHGRDVS